MPRHGRDRQLASLEARLSATGALAQAVARPPDAPPFDGTMLDAMDAAGLTGPSWAAWRVFWAAVFGLPMDADALATFTRHTGRTTPPTAPVRECWQVIGRRGGKSRNAATAAAFLAVRRDYRPVLGPGERCVIPVIAADRVQAGQVLSFLKGLARREPFAGLVTRVLKEAVEFATGCTVRIYAASFRSTRGYTVAAAICDEVAFWRSDDTGQNPDTEVIGAVRPAMLTLPDSVLLGLSTPYAARGELFKAHDKYFGQDDAARLVWNADTRSMNPSADAATIAEAFAEDPIAAASEYGDHDTGRVAFRRDVESFLDPEALGAVTVPGRRELLPVAGVAYRAFVDPSGGSQDSMTLAIAHAASTGAAVLDAVRDVRPPFSPEAVVAEFAALLTAYRVSEVAGDRYGGAWPAERFAVHGVRYAPSARTKSELYRDLLPVVNAGRCELLDVPRVRAQLLGLERRTARGGRDSIDHGPGAHDDVANAVAGALVACAGGSPLAQWATAALSDDVTPLFPVAPEAAA